jgi:outer membrane lipoprotein SlyB
MGVIMKKRQIVVFTVLLLGIANCQSWKILTTDGNKIKFDNLSIVQNDTLTGSESENVIRIPIQNIMSIWHKDIKVGKGIVGGCAGYILGIPLGMSIYHKYETGANIGVAVGAIVGYVIFSNSFGTVYELNNDNVQQKVNKINALIETFEK